MFLGLLRRQQNCTMGVGILVFLFIAFVYGLLTRDITWLQWLMVFFTLYAVVTLTAPLIARDRQIARNDFYRPFVSILIPAKNEEAVIRATIESILRLEYSRNGRPNFEIVVIDDGSTDSTPQVLREMQRKNDNLIVVSRNEGAGSGKSAALNAGLAPARGQVIAVFDADSHVNPDFLMKSVPLLYPREIAGVQGRVKLYNPDENFVTQLQNDEFLIFNHLNQKGKDVIGGVTCLGGNGQLVKREPLDEVGGWNEESLTEDFDLTFRLLAHGYQVRYAEHAELWQEAVVSWRKLFRQRIRWGQGLLNSLFDFLLPSMSAKMSLMQRVDGVVTLVRILVPFWIIDGYFYSAIQLFSRHNYGATLSPWVLVLLTLAFFVSMAWSVMRISPCRWSDMCRRVIQYWLYAVVWVLVLPISYFNFFKTSRSFYWDKTHHKGIEAFQTRAVIGEG